MSLVIRPAESLADFEAARQLIAVMAAWDKVATEALGLPTEQLLADYYSAEAPQLMAQFRQAGSAMLLAYDDAIVAGCAAYSDSGGGASEIHKMFVHPDHRGRGAARALMQSVLASMREDGYARARLETVDFMTEAIALYRSSGFLPCDAFHAVPSGLEDITLFFERDLQAGEGGIPDGR